DLYECVLNDGSRDHLLVIEVPPGRSTYATNRDEAFLRLGDESRKLSFAQRRELFYDKSQSSFESEVTDLHVSDADATLVSSYAKKLGASDALRLLEARELATDRYLTVAGSLLFAESPSRAIPSAQVRISRFQGTH